MQKLTINDIVSATGGTLVCGNPETVIENISTDSRRMQGGGLFVPLAAERDGHDYIPSAFENGADAVIAHKDAAQADGKAVVRVNDTLKAFGDIARYYLEKYRVPVISITGSVGKTTTKDLMHAAISAKYNTLKTPNNFNNDIGVPITVFGLEKEHERAVIEMGMNHFGEISYLTDIVRPDAAVITNIGMSHIENLGSREGIFKAKMEIAEKFTEKNTLIVNGDDDYLSTVKKNAPYKVVYYGITNPENDVYAKDIVNNGLRGMEFTACADGKEVRVTVTQPGPHNVYNALAAICAGRYFGVSLEDAAKGIAGCEYTENRLAVEEAGGVQIIKDFYNASPASMKAALEVLSYAEGRRKIAVLGDMLEMGEYAKDAHYEVGKTVVKYGADLLVTAGENGEYIAKGAADAGMKNVVSFADTDSAAEYVKNAVKSGDAVLIKASHGMHFEKIYNIIRG